jgi:glycerol uptake facilitator-like aquaporin
MTLSRRLAAETLGTALLLAAVVGSAIMADRLSGGNEGLTLLCNSVATGALLAVIIVIFGPVSGAHFNPAVTLAFLLRREIGASHAGLYWLCQIVGAVVGVWTAHLMFGLPVLELSTKARGEPALWFSETVATFGLVLTILGTLRWKPGAVAFTVGLYIAAAYWFTASTSFANPAVTLGRALTDTISGIDPQHVPAFIAAQFLGAVIATGFAAWLYANQALAASQTNASDTKA